ncbi:MAG: glycogen-binding domain-containing protein [Gemmatimonadota bacterium]
MSRRRRRLARRSRRVALLAAVTTLAAWSASPPLAAQWFASASLGESESLDDAAASRPVRSLRLGLLGASDLGRLRLTAGLPPAASTDLLWGQAEVATSPYVGPASRLGFGFQPDLLAQGYAYREPVAEVTGSGGLFLAEPYLAYGGRGIRARLGGGLHASATRVAEDAGPLPGPRGGAAVVRRTAGVGAADVRIAKGRMSLTARGEVLVIDGTSLPHGELTAVVGHPRGAVWAGVDHWESDAKRGTGWYLGGSLDIAEALAFQALVGRSSGEPMFGTSPSETWSIGLRYRFADRPGATSPAPLPEFESDGVLLRVPANTGEGRLSVAGSFNDWAPLPMRRSGEDWVIRLELEPGYYELAFVDETGRWFVPEGMSGRRPDGMGGWIMVLVVK